MVHTPALMTGDPVMVRHWQESKELVSRELLSPLHLLLIFSLKKKCAIPNSKGLDKVTPHGTKEDLYAANLRLANKKIDRYFLSLAGFEPAA